MSFNSLEFLRSILDTLPVTLSVFAAVSTVFAATVSGVLKLKKTERIDIEEKIDRIDLEGIKSEFHKKKEFTHIPFEVEQLANYYSLTLGQSKVSFWFSLVFAAIGFLVIVGAAFLFKEGETVSAFIKIASGLVIDAVAALFFVQSRRAQESMAAFFEKLRNDRQYVEARKICDEIVDVSVKDRLKTILVLHYSGINTKNIVDTIYSSGGDP